MNFTVNLSRRGFLGGTGALSFAVLAGGTLQVFRGEARAQAVAATPGNAWVSIAPNDEVTIRFASTEMGQGIMTSLPMILAEELDADWSKVRVAQVDQGDPAVYGNPNTGRILFTAGSSSVEGYFDIMRRAGAGARRILVHTAAAAWKVPPAEVATEPGIVLHRASGRRLSYGQVAGLPRFVTDVPEITDADLKPRSAYRLIGTDPGRRDIPGKTRGETTYSIDVRLPGMSYAALLLAPVEGETPVRIGDRAARAVPGVIDVVPLRNAVAVVAERWESALRARDMLDVAWTATSPFRDADSATDLAMEVAIARDLARPGTVWETRGNAAAALVASGRRLIDAQYTTEHVYHAQMEPLAAVAAVDPDGKGAEVWLGTQSQTLSIAAAAQALETTPDRIRFHAMQMGGGFGRRTFFARDILHDALLLSRAVKRPVKVMWTREDDVKNGWLRPATAHKLQAALDDSGRVIALKHRVASPSILAFAAPQRWANANNRDILVMEGTESRDYDIPDFLAEHVITERRARVSAWRGIGWGPNCFARECFIDELAQAANASPVAFRRQLLAKSPRGRAVLDAVVAMSNFGNAPEGRAHGLSFAGYKTTLGAGVAEISLDRPSGRIRVHRFWAAVDPGIAIHPKNLEAQTEGGIIFGLSGLLKERVTIVRGEIEQNNFYDYEPIRMNEIPEIFIRIVESGAAPSGAGEIGVPMTGAAVANAFFGLTGKRIRDMPFTPERVLALTRT
ncbi:molybdopterin cofactor-binding domain-containing protein [Burkholderia cenocepacia]|uniref:xanthine dehydrogenase family protein molybdopterin-binding subunit n=1 Tax=Burkholderia cenocepacia TaxID=95486 RepID=UPI000F5AE62B|nr:molybdopterin cofactor-binding domain-containing protein [Burkholderia cenocepacia]RQU89459.1 xanthine dehydrogenase family protein molybdopterin-binding subunit [Burkholderia cenocepacia]